MQQGKQYTISRVKVIKVLQISTPRRRFSPSRFPQPFAYRHPVNVRPVPSTFAACSPPVAFAPVRPARCPFRRAARPLVTCEGREPVGASGPISGDGATVRPVPSTFAACSPPVAFAPVRPACCPSRRAARPVPLAVRPVPCRMSAQHRAAQPCARSRGAFRPACHL